MVADVVGGWWVGGGLVSAVLRRLAAIDLGGIAVVLGGNFGRTVR